MWNVLVVDDDLTNCQQIVRALENIAHCTTAVDGLKAIKTYQKSRRTKKYFDFILLDVTLPEMDGFEILRKIRTEEEKRQETTVAPRPFILMITAYKDSLMDKYNMGWDDFITKPVDPPKLIEHMKALIEKK